MQGGLGMSHNSISTHGGSPTYEARVIRFRQELKSNTINLADVRALAFEGVPDKGGLRPLVWKVCCIATVTHGQPAATAWWQVQIDSD